eukprot:SAG11_NODE_1189_length_5576_cov_3.002739_5_plen_61_part_00
MPPTAESSKGPWTAEEDAKLKDLVGAQNLNHVKWSGIAANMDHRNSKQCVPKGWTPHPTA